MNAESYRNGRADSARGHRSDVQSDDPARHRLPAYARKAGGPNPFIDPDALQNFMAKADAAFDTELAHQRAAAKR